MKQLPKVNEVNEFLEIASDFEDPLELLRESLSNSFDARAERVDITIRSHSNGSDIIIEDDGEGMDHGNLESFFDLGNSKKTDSIGYKGHGTKIFYKSDKIVVNTTKDGTTLHATMEKPWEKLNDRTLPEYEVRESDAPQSRSGTYIKISGFKSGHGFNPGSLTYPKIHNYLKWKTIAGSTAHFFDDDFHEMEIHVKLDEEIDDSQEKLTTTNKFTFPSQQLQPGNGDFPAKRMCKRYGPEELEIEHDDGTSTVEVVGMAGGKDTRNELPTFGRHSTQFGIWLAKDHIKVERLNEAIAHDNEFIHFLFVANCQDIELSANREKIRNKSSSVYQELEEELGHYLSKVTHDPWFKGYLNARREGEIVRKASSESANVVDRVKRIEGGSFEPTNQAEILFTLQQAAAQSEDRSFVVEDFRPGDDVTAIVRRDDTLEGAAVWESLYEHFDNESPLSPIDVVVCWDWGDKDSLRELERSGYLGTSISFDFDNNSLTYSRDEEEGTCDIIVVSDIRSVDQQSIEQVASTSALD
ncbi:ATP-binding protein [Haloarchaeobius sp. DFWS5]|uniref:ATP-binding protein n=1 Tax=Haloarchaeobius sp. DFWS5 TaxID=3446114 RepID=UPI003EBC572C